MQIRELSQPVTSQKLNESLAKKFGYSINLEQFSDVQLEDARNKLRTKISQFEMNESYDQVLESPEYQKTRMFLDVLNQEILERDGSDEDEKDVENDVEEGRGEEEQTMQEGYMARTMRRRAMEASIPNSWIDGAIERMQLGESDADELKAELALRYDLNESAASWILAEGEQDKAETIMATKDMVDKITGWLEDVAQLKAEHLLELLDSIRETSGSDVAQRYQDAVKPALEAIYTALETSRQGLSSGLGIVSGEEVPTMGAPVGGAPAMGDASAVPGVPPMGGEEGELGGEEEAMPEVPSAEAGRMKRESAEYSRRLGMLLSSKKN